MKFGAGSATLNGVGVTVLAFTGKYWVVYWVVIEFCETDSELVSAAW